MQLYLRDVTASLVRPVQELKAFTKVTLEPGQRETVTLTLSKGDMGFYDDEMNYRLEDGDFVLSVGGSCRDVLSETLQIKF